MFYKITLLLLLTAIVITLSASTLMLGNNSYSFSQLWHITAADHNDYFILHDVRLPRLIINLYCGMLFALAGSIFQAVFKNPVASPDILGINAIAIFTILIFSNLFGSPYGVFPYALVGVIGGFGLIIALATTDKKIVTTRLIIIGLAISILFRALGQLLVIQSNEGIYNILTLLNGTSYQMSWETVAATTYPTVIFIGVCLLCARYLDVILHNTFVVKTIGMNLDFWQIFFIGLALLMSAIAVSASGSLGFIGLIAPNISRLIFGFSHRYNLYGSLLIGCILILGSDLVGRVIFYPLEIPAGIIMIFIGTPVFIFLLKDVSRRSHG